MDQGIIVVGILAAFIVALLIIQQVLKGKLQSIDAQLEAKQKTATPKPTEVKPLVSGKAITGASAVAQAENAVREAIELAIAQVTGGKAKVVSVQKI